MVTTGAAAKHVKALLLLIWPWFGSDLTLVNLAPDARQRKAAMRGGKRSEKGSAAERPSKVARRQEGERLDAVALSHVLEDASAEMKGDRMVVLAAVAQKGRALQYASEELKGDREVVLAAVAQNGYALEYVSEELKGDREVGLAAVARNGLA
eukprot:CAMPEP_0175835794 /NCGR_PEP_ID=MMETSP0107_2-20121207/16791_1 /TAXON_ID=195067 ORGANISM="Goniomonas pacifica, Strain CCMP1869" /NCGR_SAMPLE_ID=MMETSP0107_2 /ASSEMBLY_ACC=CAM_ASM_000203 /LENGTH=152 /DNA_ID=CAMNT_0017149129 /DNA_START=624 /DNA_END=1081 /DNA_ORIENTATION=+